jgi:hypothetical protein
MAAKLNREMLILILSPIIESETYSLYAREGSPGQPQRSPDGERAATNIVIRLREHLQSISLARIGRRMCR